MLCYVMPLFYENISLKIFTCTEFLFIATCGTPVTGSVLKVIIPVKVSVG